MIAFTVLFLGLMLPAAIAWVFAFLLFQRSAPSRLTLVAAIIVGVAYLLWPASILLIIPAMFASLAIVGILEWTLARDRK